MVRRSVAPIGGQDTSEMDEDTLPTNVHSNPTRSCVHSCANVDALDTNSVYDQTCVVGVDIGCRKKVHTVWLFWTMSDVWKQIFSVRYMSIEIKHVNQ